MLIYLSAECFQSLGDDTFWTWMLREFPNARQGIPDEIGKTDVVLRYGTLGASPFPRNTIALLWELYPEMARVLGPNQGWAETTNRLHECAASSARRTVATGVMVSEYEKHGQVDVLPIGVDTNVFRPVTRDARAALRKKWGVPQDRLVGFWGGTTHPMKGFDGFCSWLSQNDAFGIAAWKWQPERGTLEGGLNTVQLPQPELAEVMACADVLVASNLLRPYCMIEWEAMACGLVPVGFQTERECSGEEAHALLASGEKGGWSRQRSAKRTWRNYIAEFMDELAQ